jgi:ketosteroid isomerase-like protein
MHAPTLLVLTLLQAGVASSPVDLAKRFINDFQTERVKSISDYLAPDAIMTMPFTSDGPVMLRGRGQTEAYLRSVCDRYRIIRILKPVYTPAADGRTVFAEARGLFEANDGKRHEVGYVWAITVVGGRIKSSRTYTVPITRPAS